MKILERRNLFFYGIVFLLILYIFVIDSSSFRTVLIQKNKNNELRERIEDKTIENQRLAVENDNLKKNRETWEEEARKLGMQKKGEDIYRFTREDSQ
ncbi:MAG: septum formation initiator family protein [Candidatus Cloacimonetes bacterium]|nr:septum formation initiator family protein [Candidatus Cloacimonadota bacterium]